MTIMNKQQTAVQWQFDEPPVWENFEQYYNKTYGTE